MDSVVANRKHIMVVDDEEGIRSSLQLLLKRDFEVTTVASGAEALTKIRGNTPDLILLDVMMPELDGISTLKKLREDYGSIPVIMLTATTTVKTAVQAIKIGAVDYLNKPFEIDELTSRIVDNLSITPPPAAIAYKKKSLPSGDLGQMVGQSEIMKEVFKKVSQVAPRDSTVLITGESGTGKELVARQIHEMSPRKDGPFIAINCAAIPETLIESELFGHEKGSFTSAIERRVGHFELADGGTLFLDEIGELSIPVQVKMLRFLQEQEFFRVGRSQPIRVNVRIITATNQDLEQLVKAQRFRQDLFYRINVINLNVPPLRDRYDDIGRLIEHFCEKFTGQYGGRKLSFSEDAQICLREYNWPGNVRELENVIESLMALSVKDQISAEDLPPRVCKRASVNYDSTVADGLSFEAAEKIFETDIILKALKRTNYVQNRAADLLGISRRILKYKMDKLGISTMPEIQRALLSDVGDDSPQ